MAATVAFKVMLRTKGTVLLDNGLHTGPGHWASTEPTKQIECTLALSAPTAVRSVHVEVSGEACGSLIEILAGDEKGDDFSVLAPAQTLMTVSEWKYRQQQESLANGTLTKRAIRCNPPSSLGSRKWNRLRLVVRGYTSSILGLASVSVSQERLPREKLPAVGTRIKPRKDVKSMEASAKAKITAFFSPSPSSNAAVLFAPTQVLDDDPWDASDEEEETVALPTPASQPLTMTEGGEEDVEMDVDEQLLPMEGLTIVISGIANPERGQVRKMALDLGAKYSGEWSDQATHLVCPAPNKNKYAAAVKDRKTIVQSEWVRDCHLAHAILPVGPYELPGSTKLQATVPSGVGKRKREPSDHGGPSGKRRKIDYSFGGWLDSDTEGTTSATMSKQGPATVAADWGLPLGSSDFVNAKTAEKAEAMLDESEEDDMTFSGAEPPAESSSGDLNSEEASTGLGKRQGSIKGNLPATFMASMHHLGPMATALAGKTCYIHGAMPPHDTQSLQRMVIALGGCIDSYVYTNTSYVLCGSEWEGRFNAVQDRQPDMLFVTRSWLLESIMGGTLLDPTEFILPED